MSAFKQVWIAFSQSSFPSSLRCDREREILCAKQIKNSQVKLVCLLHSLCSSLCTKGHAEHDIKNINSNDDRGFCFAKLKKQDNDFFFLVRTDAIMAFFFMFDRDCECHTDLRIVWLILIIINSSPLTVSSQLIIGSCVIQSNYKLGIHWVDYLQGLRKDITFLMPTSVAVRIKPTTEHSLLWQ